VSPRRPGDCRTVRICGRAGGSSTFVTIRHQSGGITQFSRSPAVSGLSNPVASRLLCFTETKLRSLMRRHSTLRLSKPSGIRRSRVGGPQRSHREQKTVRHDLLIRHPVFEAKARTHQRIPPPKLRPNNLSHRRGAGPLIYPPAALDDQYSHGSVHPKHPPRNRADGRRSQRSPRAKSSDHGHASRQQVCRRELAP